MLKTYMHSKKIKEKTLRAIKYKATTLSGDPSHLNLDADRIHGCLPIHACFFPRLLPYASALDISKTE